MAEIMRYVTMRESSFSSNKKRPTVDIVIASDSPVERWDEDRDEMVKEILLMDGVEFRSDLKQLPIVDSHDRSTVRNILGSVRDIKVENGQLVGRAVFATDSDSQRAYGKLKEGHLTDFSITATPKEIKKIPRGEVVTVNGKEMEGPLDLVTRWMPTDASLVGVGADVNSRVRKILRSYKPRKRNDAMAGMMDEDTKEKLISHGMPEDMVEDEERAIQWMLSRMAGDDEEEEGDDIELAEGDDDLDMEEADELKKCRDFYSKKRAGKEPAKGEEEEIEFEEDEEEEKVGVAVERALKQDRKRRNEIQAICRSAKLPRGVASKYADSGLTSKAVKRKVLKRMANKPVGGISVGSNGNIERTLDMRDALIVRDDPSYEARKGARNFQHASLLRMAEEIIRSEGVNTDRLSATQIAQVAMNHRPTIERMAYLGEIKREGSYATTGAFPNLLLDVTNKSLLKGYTESPQTWSQWCRTATPVKDFKEINKIKFSESPNLVNIPENTLYPEAPMSDEREKYSVEKFGSSFSCTFELIVNDDLGALQRLAALQGAAAKRTQNQTVYNKLLANDVMADGVALFAGAHNNLGTGAALGIASLDEAYTKMRLQTGLDGTTILNITPTYLCVPAALEATAYQLINSIADPTAGGTAVGSSGVANIYGPSGPRRLTVIVEPLLDGNSSTAWYLMASNSMIDTMELSFLSGEQTPVLENEFDIRRDSYFYKIRQTFGVGVVDYRGLFKNAGV